MNAIMAVSDICPGDVIKFSRHYYEVMDVEHGDEGDDVIVYMEPPSGGEQFYCEYRHDDTVELKISGWAAQGAARWCPQVST